MPVPAGASPRSTDNGSDERPIRCPARWLTDQVSAAVTAIPSNAAAAHMTLWRVTVIALAS
jgi:hypothetical protein